MIWEATRLARSGASGMPSSLATRVKIAAVRNSRSIVAACSLETAERTSPSSGLRVSALSHSNSSRLASRSPVRSGSPSVTAATTSNCAGTAAATWLAPGSTTIVLSELTSKLAA
jgi:hypothetical protein